MSRHVPFLLLKRASVVMALALLLFPFFTRAQTVDLVTDPSFNAGDIIGDEDMNDVASMTADDIQRFLSGQPGTLSRYSEATPPSGEAKTAAQIIFEASQDNHINPEILLTMLQKEQSLVEDSKPSQGQFDWATGYSKCDGCSGLSVYKGFFNQVYATARRLRYFMDNPSEFTVRAGNTITTSDGFNVALINQATAALYIYNPWRGGAKVDDRFVGANHNFWKIWNRYFAPSITTRTLVKERDSDTYWLIDDGIRRGFIAPEVFSQLYTADDRAKATVLPARKITRYFRQGPPITLNDAFAGIYVDQSFATKPWFGSTVAMTVRFKNLGIQSWKKGQVLLAMTNTAGGPLPIKTKTWPQELGGWSFNEDHVDPGGIATFTTDIHASDNDQPVEVLLALRSTVATDASGTSAVSQVPATAAQAFIRAATLSGAQQSFLLTAETPIQGVADLSQMPTYLKPRQNVRVAIRITNTGNVVWKRGHVRLSTFADMTAKTSNPFYHYSWRDKTRVAWMREALVKPGETGTFSFVLYAPKAEKTYTQQYQFSIYDDPKIPLSKSKDGVIVPLSKQSSVTVSTVVAKIKPEPAAQLVGVTPPTPGASIGAASTVSTTGSSAGVVPSTANVAPSSGPYSAQLIESTIPTVIRPLSASLSQFRLKNNGTVTWKRDTIRLSAFGDTLQQLPSPLAHPAWRDTIRVSWMNEKEVPPGSIGSWNVPLKIPAIEGTFQQYFRWSVHDGGPASAGTVITVSGNALIETITQVSSTAALGSAGTLSTMPPQPVQAPSVSSAPTPTAPPSPAASITPVAAQPLPPPSASTGQSSTGPRRMNSVTVFANPHVKDGSILYVFDDRTLTNLYASDKRDVLWPMAGITKLLSAFTVLNQKTDLTKTIALEGDDEVGGTRLNVPSGSKVPGSDLLAAALLGSANNAIKALSRVASPDGTFVDDMNTLAKTLGMDSTTIIESTGVSPMNTSTADDIAKLAKAAFDNTTIRSITITAKKDITVRSPDAKKITLVNQNTMIKESALTITGSMVGYSQDANYNIVVRLSTKTTKPLIVILLGEPSYDQAFSDAEALAQWSWKAYQW